jgi:peptidyl-prolyl cis-trans isomerase B (cyclophilin B)
MALRRGLPLVILVLALAACGGGSKSSTSTTASSLNCIEGGGGPTNDKTMKPPTEPLDSGKTYTVTMLTNKGSFSFRLNQKQSPANAASFAKLVQARFFDGTIFHRIVPGFVIQGGDPTATGNGGPGYECIDTPPATASYTHGVVAMAKTTDEPAGTGGSQFFVVTAGDAQLTPDYAIVGRVTSGIKVVDRIGRLGDPSTQQPTQRVTIEKAALGVS